MDMIKKVRHFFSYWYLRYLLVTELYIVEPWERVLVHVMLAVLFLMVWIFNYSMVMSSVSHLKASAESWQIL